MLSTVDFKALYYCHGVCMPCMFQGGLLADLSSTLATLQSVVQSITQVRGVVRQMKAQSGHSADILSASSVTDRHQSLS